ncbi:MAG: hypothetical protein HYZ53_26370 [Planctomycetes bacterium]|nr:hypothetical protein [Planctomycetota bacterium]
MVSRPTLPGARFSPGQALRAWLLLAGMGSLLALPVFAAPAGIEWLTTLAEAQAAAKAQARPVLLYLHSDT